MKRLIFLVLISLFFPTASSLSTESNQAVELQQKEFELLDLSNRDRLNSLVWDDCLATAAKNRAKFLLKNNYFAHYTPDGKTPWEFIKTCPYSRAGENLAKGFHSISEMHQAFMASQTHRENIQDKRFAKMGIGCEENICVEFFSN